MDQGEDARQGGAGAAPEPDRRTRRMVTMRVPFRIEDDGGLKLEGYTTGINEHGMAGRMNMVAGDWPALVDGHPVRILIDLPRDPVLAPMEGVILRVEGSWVPETRYFISVRFARVLPADLDYLRTYVQWREERYFTDDKPSRLWYLFSAEFDQQYGPLTSAEVLASAHRRGFTAADMLWSPRAGEWIPFDEEEFRGLAEVRRIDRRAVFALLATLFFITGLFTFGFRQGWMDLGASARRYRAAADLVAEGKLAPGMQELNELMRMHPESPWAVRASDKLWEAQQALQIHRDQQLASERLSSLQKTDPAQMKHPVILSNFGDCYFRLGDYAKARDYFTKASEAAPGSARILTNLGTCSLKMRLPGEALGQFRRAASLSAGRPELYMNMGLANLLLGRRDDAREAFERAVRLQPENRERRAAIELAWDAAP